MLLLFRKTKQDFHLKDRTGQDRTGQTCSNVFFFFFEIKHLRNCMLFNHLALQKPEG